MRRRKFEFLTILGLIAVLLSSTAGYATAPVAKDIPDIRNEISAGAPAAPFLDLDDYVVDPDDRNATSSAQLPLTWGENTSGDDNVGIGAGNELEVIIPSSAAPELGVTTFSVQDASADTVFTNPVTVRTVDFLIGGPLVDAYLVTGDTLGSANPIPYSWCAEEGDTLRVSGVSQSGAGGRLHASVASGIGSTCFISDSAIVAATDITQPVNPFEPGVDIHGVAAGNLSTVSLNAANISVDADLNGMFVSALAGFSDWVRVSVTRTFGSGAKDTYSIAVGDVLLGVVANDGASLSGTPDGGASIVGAEEVYGFDNVTLTQFLGASSAAAYEAAATTNINNSETSWIVAAIGQNAAGLNGGSLGEVSLTTSVPASSYPGSNNDRALCVELDQPDLCGILLRHKGLDPASYSAGDIITLSVNMYVDLNYGVSGGQSADIVNEATSSPSIALGLATQPLSEAANYNYVTFPYGVATAAPFRKGADGGVFGTYGQGGSRLTNIAAGLHGKWTRHEVSLRVPESGVAVTGSAGTGNIAYANGITALILAGRIDTSMTNHPQYIYLDNICVSKVPGSLVLAEGATNVPMVSAGFAFQYADGTSDTNGTGSTLPASIARGEVIYGSFSDSSTGNSPATVLSNASNNATTFVQGNANAGWTHALGNTDIGFIAQGNADVALGFPTLASGNKSLALAPSPAVVSGNYPTPNTTVASPHAGAVEIDSPYLDMRLAADAVLPGLHVDDVTYADGTGGAEQQNAIAQNVSGVFGVRFFHRTNATAQSQNPSVAVLFTNADVSNGLVASRQPNTLTSGDNTTYSGNVWIDDMVTGNVVSFNSPNYYYDLVLNSQNGGRFTNGGNDALSASLQAENPGAQLGKIGVVRGNGGSPFFNYPAYDAAGFNIYQDVYGTGGAIQANTLPGRYSTATVFVDEISVHAVRDSGAFYDEDLAVLP